MSEEYLQLGDMPSDFRDVLMREFVPYSVGLGRVSEDDHKLFTSLGSGTLVKKGTHIGILSAQHCLTACSPRVRVGPNGKDSLLLILRDARGVQLRPEDMIEHRLVTPLSADYGPDLVFVEIAPSEKLQRILSVASVWSLDRDHDKILKEFGEIGSMVASLGIPEELCRTQLNGNAFHRTSFHLTVSYVIHQDSISVRNGWDYIDNKCVYSESSALPQSFAGFSGGGIWSVQIHRSKSTGLLSAGKAALVGVSFYETPIENDVRYVRGHFVRSIYDLAWRDFERSQL
jgi:hypothetical protein